MNNIENTLNFLKQEIGIHKYPWLETLYNKVLENKPLRVIEFGTKTGLTAITMGLALKQLGRGNIITYDCFDQPVENRISDIISIEKAEANIKKWNCQDIIEVKKGDFYEWIKNPDQFDLLYLDIDNDGDKLQLVYDNCFDQIIKGSVVIFEGGSLERDNVHWMIKHNRTSINSIKSVINYKVIDLRFPSLSMIKR